VKAQTLQNLLDANPFRPFAINLADGRALRVPHRDFASPSPNYRMLTIWHQDDSADFVDMLLVIGFHLEKPHRNGRTKARKARSR
jgi:hypothetical protein